MTTPALRVHLLDVGHEEYGDALLLEVAGKTVLVDGAHPGDDVGDDRHPSIPLQLADLLGQQDPPYTVDLLIVSHAHDDHIGCLPKLVRDDVVRARWALVSDPDLGWGRPVDDAGGRHGLPDAAAEVVAGLREEPRKRVTDGELRAFLIDARSLEDRYRAMLDQLQSAGTHVVRHGRDTPTSLKRAFKSAGLQILGPSEDQLVICADVIDRRQDSAARIAQDALRVDAALDSAELYRMLNSGDFVDAIDMARSGPAVNLQSIVVSFEVDGRRLLLAGDMQLADPQISDARLEQEITELRSRIAAGAPYRFVKLSHHGSDNALSAEILADLGKTKTFGICAGEGSTAHPNADVLELLHHHTPKLTWARTDHNGLVTVDLARTQPKFTLTRGRLDDPRPNASDVEPVPPAPPAPIEPSEPVVAAEPGRATTQTTTTAEFVEVVTRVPNQRTRVTVSIEVEPGSAARAAVVDRDVSTMRLAGGRQLPPLLFVTHPAALARNVGEVESSRILSVLAAHRVCEIPDPASHESAVSTVRAALRAAPDVKGVVLVGGYDVVPSGRVDCLPPRLRTRIGAGGDPDEFIVWSDDGYVDTDDDNLPELPISRIPDGKSAELVTAALSAPNRLQRQVVRSGVRNVARPFAGAVFDAVRGPEPLLISDPTTFRDHDELGGEHVYLMLHGDFVDGSRFWGEDTPSGLEAVNVGNVPAEAGSVIFTGCCWGALTVDTPANRVTPGRPFGQKTPDGSVALSFLRAGATAFIGCTGAHYSPTEPPYDYYGGPLHAAFWDAYQRGAAPAAALFAAKSAYAGAVPHRAGAGNEAIELKIFRQYTCLGLGW
jgi:beta-lactamase superfamily II metal-dependent hydrolase